MDPAHYGLMAAIIGLLGVIFGPIIAGRIKSTKAVNGITHGINPEEEQAGRMSVEFWGQRFEVLEKQTAEMRKDWLKEMQATRRLLRERLPPKSWWKANGGPR